MEKTIFSTEQKVLQELLRQFRMEAGVTQVELARRLETTQVTVSNIERGERRLDLIELYKVLDAIGIPLSDFIRRYEELVGRAPKKT